MKHTKIIAWLLALALLLPCLPVAGHAADAFEFSVAVSPETASIGGEALVTVSLEGYDTASIAGLQVDITGIDPDVLEVKNYASAIDDAEALSNKASYNTEQQRVRLLYLRESGTLAAPCEEVLTMTVKIDPDLTEAGSITLPMTIKVVTADSEQYTLTSGCTIKYMDATALESFEYTLDAENGSVILTKYIGTDKAVVVAPTYTVDGTEYSTVLVSTSVFVENTTITSVRISDGVKFRDNTMYALFYKCGNLVSADLNGLDTTGVTDMAFMFAECGKLTSVDMTGVDTSCVTTMRCLFSKCYKLKTISGYEDWDTSSLEVMYMLFNYVQSMETIDLSKWDLSKMINSGWCFQFCYAKYILLPDNIHTMSAGFLNHATKYEGTTFTIPAGVQRIGYGHTIYDFSDDDFVEFIVPESNENYVAIDGILYSADGREMLAVPRGKTFENNTYVIPEGVDFLGELSFSRNYNIHTVVLPNSYELEYVPQYDPRYILVDDTGNLNAGSNLNIAIYLYTGITDYAVKEDNPRYTSIDGIIYSKDMTSVVAVPTRYNKHINIPEGVETWEYEAMWADQGTCSFMQNCSGVSIPSTMTEISADQMDKLNKMNEKYASFEITVAEGNPVYGVDEDGYLFVKGVAVAKNTTTRASYSTVSTALTAAKAGETVILLTDCSDDTVVVPAGVVLDLNGHVLQAENVLSFGSVIDTAETVGGISIDIDTAKAFVKLQRENAGYLPIYDTVDGQYKFFGYDVESNMAMSNGSDVSFYTRIVFDRAEAYRVLAATENSGIDYLLTMSWKGMAGFDIRYRLSDSTMGAYALAAYDQLVDEGYNGKAMIVTVKGFDRLDEDGWISAAPSAMTLTGVGASAETIRYPNP